MDALPRAVPTGTPSPPISSVALSGPLRVVAAGSDPRELEAIGLLLQRQVQIDLVGLASDCAGVLASMRLQRPDLLLLEARMRDGTAFDVMEALPPVDASIVAIMTTEPADAFRAFETGALDCLMKPAEPDRLNALLLRARERLEARSRVGELEGLIARLLHDADADPPTAFASELWIRHKGTDRIRVAIRDIDLITAQDDYACIHAEGREHLLRTSLDRLMDKLDPATFVRIHRSTIVRIDTVDRISLKSPGVREAVLRDGTRLAVGRVHARSLPWTLRGAPDG